MNLFGLFTVCVLLLASADAQSCPRITEEDLGSTAAASTVGLIAQRLAVDLDSPPAVQLMRFNRVCEATSPTMNEFRYVSVVAEYRSNDILELSQFEFACTSMSGGDVWGIEVSGSTDYTITSSPSADFSTELRTNCYSCLGPLRSTEADDVHHCLPCNSFCTQGLQLCTTPFGCCAYYSRAGTCVSSCPSPTVSQPDNTCNCPPGTTGANCDVPFDICATDPCMNSGTCTNSGSTFECACSADYTGEMCETLVDPCDDTPCLNGGTCTRETFSDFTCSCPGGFSSDTCVDINECLSPTNPCLNGGTCQNTVGSYMCQCQGNWEGMVCETCGISNCTTCSSDRSLCVECDEGFVINPDNNFCAVSTVNFLCEQECSANGICNEGNCLCLPGFVNPPNCTAQCTLSNCEQCTPDGIACQICDSGYVVDSNGGLCVRGISREINLSDIEIIAIVACCLIFGILVLIVVVCCCGFICGKMCKNSPRSYVESKPPPQKKHKKHVKKHVHKKTRSGKPQQTSIINEMENGGAEPESDIEGGEKDVDLDITHF